MKAVSSLARGVDTVLCSHNHHFTLCNRLTFSPPIPNPTPNLTRSRPPIIITFFKPIPPKTHRFVLKAKAADSTQPASLSSTTSADKTIVSDEEFSLAKVPFPPAPLFSFYFLRLFRNFDNIVYIYVIELCLCVCM